MHVKAVKLLRRGRRLQQVEAIYGKVVGPDGTSGSSQPSTRLPSIIPQLSPEFFVSAFWTWFAVQRPVLDPVEFSARYIAHSKGIQPLGHEGGLLAMILVIWAASFGLDERGIPEDDDARDCSDQETPTAITHSTGSKRGSSNQDSKGKDPMTERSRKDKKENTEAMLREVLELIDFHGVMRRPSWDGVRALLLIMPLLEEAHPLERLAMYEATLSQTQALCTLSGSSAGPTAPITPFPDTTDDSVLRARIFWYAHMQEGFSTGMRGGRLVLDNDDYEAFQHTLPAYAFNADGSPISAPPSPPESLRPLSSHGLLPQSESHPSTAAQTFYRTSQLFSLPLQLGAICRKVHHVLTGPKATRRAEEHGLIDAHGMREIWEDLDLCWKHFDSMRRNGILEQESASLEQFVSAWQCMTRTSDSSGIFSGGSPSRPSSHSSSSPYLSPHHLHVIATRKCLDLLPLVLRIIKFHLTQDERGLFRWDAGLVRDGCFFAGFLAASIDSDAADSDDDDQRGRGRLAAEEGVALCLAALSEMRWGFSRSEEREETVRMIWENRKVGRNTGRYTLNSFGRAGYADSTYRKHMPPIQTPPYTSHGYPTMSGHDRPLLPPLRSPRRAESAPSTAYTTNGQGGNGWPSYTPPGTATSVATSAGTGVSVSARGSPLFNSVAAPMSYKSEVHEPFYHVPADMDQFSFHAPAGPGMNDGPIIGNGHYHHRDPPSSAHSMHSTSSSTYLDPGVFSGSGSSMVHPASDAHNCSQFGEDCNGYYH
ncbi:hypothetical protein DXG01_001066 [Tephrocybe rancida]|nr:hypothetical protein DXG01_001066 [Tephrocybe rancida]